MEDNYALQLNGTNAYLRIPGSSAYNFATEDFTLEVQVKTKKPGTILYHASGSNLGFTLSVEKKGVIQFAFLLSGGHTSNPCTSSSTNILDGNWHHLAIVRRSGQMVLYLDAEPIKTTTVPALNLTSNSFVSVGAACSATLNANLFLDGELDEIRFWNTALKQSDILDMMYMRLSGQEEYLVGYWNFDAANGNDLSANHNNGSLEGDAFTGDSNLLLNGANYMLSLNGLNGALEIPNTPALQFETDDFTVEIWFATKSGGQLLSTLPATGTQTGYTIQVTDEGTILFTLYDAASTTQTVTVRAIYPLPCDVLDHDWHHLAVRRHNQYFTIFLDGIKVGADYLPVGESFSVSNRAPLLIGAAAGQQHYENVFNGHINEIVFWNSARTGHDIRQNMYNGFDITDINLVGYWTFDFQAADSNLGDQIINGVLNGAAKIVGCNRLILNHPAYALQLDGTSGYVNVGPVNQAIDWGGSTPYTVELWVRPEQENSNGTLISKMTNPATGLFSIGLSNGQVQVTCRGNTLNGNVRMKAKQWYHIAVTCGGGNLSFYLNGNLEAVTTPGTDTNNYSSTPVLLGAVADGTLVSGYFQGQIQWMRIWGTAKPGNQIRENLFDLQLEYDTVLLGLWDFSGPHDVDFSGYNNPKNFEGNSIYTISDFPYFPFSHALWFDGGGQYINCGTGLSIPNPVTLEAWIKTRGPGTSSQVIMAQGDIWKLELNTSGHVVFSSTALTAGITSDITVTDGLWHHLALTYDGSQLILFIDTDAHPQSPVPATGSLVNTQTALTIGAGSPVTGTCFNGFITQVSIWNMLFTKNDLIQHRYHRLLGKETNLSACWECVRKGETHEANITGTGNNGTYVFPTNTPIESRLSDLTIKEPLPQILAHSQLMEDYHLDDEGRTFTVSTYRTQITVVDANGSPKPGENLLIWSSSACTIRVDGIDHAIDNNTCAIFNTDLQGHLELTTHTSSTHQDGLFTPALKIWTYFMQPDERVVIMPDEDVHKTFSTLSGQKLIHSGILPQDHEKNADNIAAAISKTMGMVEPNYQTPPEHIVRLCRGTHPPKYTHHLDATAPHTQQGNVTSDFYLIQAGKPFKRVIEGQAKDSYSLTFHHDTAEVHFSTLSAEHARIRMDHLAALGLSWTGTWKAFWKTVKTVTNIVVRATEAVIDITITSLKWVYNTVVDTVERAIDVIANIFKQIGVAISKVIEWLKFVFEWQDILNSKKVINHYFDGMFTQIIGLIDTGEQKALNFLNQTETNITQFFDTFITRFSDVSVDQLRNSGQGPHHSLGQNANPAADYSLQKGWLFSKTREYQDQSSSSSSGWFEMAEMGNNFFNPYGGFAGSVAIELAKQPDIQKAFADAMDYWGRILSNPDRLSQLLVQGLLEMLKGLALAGIKLAEKLVTVLFDMLKSVVQGFRDTLNKPLQIPVITYLYENVINKGDGSKLTIIDFFSLVIAIPATVIYKSIAGEAPFSNAKTRQILATPVPSIIAGNPAAHLTETSTAPAGRNPIDRGVELFQGIAYGVYYILFAPFDALKDIQQVTKSGGTPFGAGGQIGKSSPVQQFSPDAGPAAPGAPAVSPPWHDRFNVQSRGGNMVLNISSIVVPVLGQIFGYPGGLGNSLFQHDETAAEKMDDSIWVYQWVPIATDIVFTFGISLFQGLKSSWKANRRVSLYYAPGERSPWQDIQSNLKYTQAAGKIGPIIASVTGGIHLGLFITLAAMEGHEGNYSHLKTAQNILSAIPESFKFLRIPRIVAATEGWSLVGLTAGDLLCDAAAGVLSIIRADKTFYKRSTRPGADIVYTASPSYYTVAGRFNSQEVTYTINITNNTGITEQLTALRDSEYGDVSAITGSNYNGQPVEFTMGHHKDYRFSEIFQNKSAGFDRTYTVTATFTADTPVITATANGTATVQVTGPAAALAFVTQPAAAQTNKPIIPGITVEIHDSGGRLVRSDNTTTITMTLNPTGGNLSGATVITAVNGSVTFTDLRVAQAGQAYTLTATASPALTSAVSQGFRVTGPPSQWVYTSQPVNAVAGAAISPAIALQVRDSAGNPILSDNSTRVSVAIHNPPDDVVLSGTHLVTANSGTVTFNNLNVNKAGTYQLSITSTPTVPLATAPSNSFTITAGSAAKLEFQDQPSTMQANQAISPAVTAAVMDASGNIVTSDSTTSVTIAIGTNPSDGTLSGTIPQTASSGIVTFDNLTINKPANRYTLKASATGLIPAESNSSGFNITSATPTQLDFSIDPPNPVVVSTVLSPPVRVVILDSQDHQVMDANPQTVTVALGTNPGGATLGGTLSRTAQDGIAEFDDLTVNKVGSGYTLTAASGTLTGATSSTFNVLTTGNMAAEMQTAGSPPARVARRLKADLTQHNAAVDYYVHGEPAEQSLDDDSTALQIGQALISAFNWENTPLTSGYLFCAALKEAGFTETDVLTALLNGWPSGIPLRDQSLMIAYAFSPTLEQYAEQLKNGGNTYLDALPKIRRKFPVSSAEIVSETFARVFSFGAYQQWATPLAVSMQHAGYGQDLAITALLTVFPDIPLRQQSLSIGIAYDFDD